MENNDNINNEPTNETKGIFHKIILLFVYIFGYGFIIFFIVEFFFPSIFDSGKNINSTKKNGNILENSIMINSSNEEDFNKFIRAGGLAVENKWKNYKVEDVSVTYNNQKKVNHVELRLLKIRYGFSFNKIATIDNLIETLSNECGDNWKLFDSKNYYAIKDKTFCEIIDKSDISLKLRMSLGK